MTKKQLQMLYDRMKIENETYKQFIIHMHGQQTIDRLDMEIALQAMDEANRAYLIESNLKKYEK